MTDPLQMKQQAQLFRERKNYFEAHKLYESLWKEHRQLCDEWDGWAHAFCLRKLKRPEEAIAVCREVYKAKPDFERNNSLYAWCIYDIAIAKRSDEEIKQDEARFFRGAKAITDLTHPGKYSPCAKTIFRVVGYLKEQNPYPTQQILEWIAKLNPDQLSTEVGRGTDNQGKPREYASDREKWYAEYCTALFEAGDFQACIELADEALAAFSRFHYDNDVWFKWRRALAKAELGNKETAIQEIQSLLSRKKDWFIYHRIAQFQFDLGQLDEAWANAVDAALGPGDLEYKWELFLLMATILQNQEQMDEARLHALLAARVRQEHEWKMPQKLTQVIEDLEVDLTSDATAFDIQKSLRKKWRTAKQASLPRCTGEIVKLLSNDHGRAHAGFIAGDDGQDYYFKTSSFQGPRQWLSEGLIVKFLIEKNPDPKQRDNAVFVKPQKK